MQTLLTFLTSKRTTALSVLANVALLFLDVKFMDALTATGLSAALAAQLTSAAKALTLALAALGYSPLTRPKPAADA